MATSPRADPEATSWGAPLVSSQGLTGEVLVRPKGQGAEDLQRGLHIEAICKIARLNFFCSPPNLAIKTFNNMHLEF